MLVQPIPSTAMDNVADRLAAYTVARSNILYASIVSADRSNDFGCQFRHTVTLSSLARSVRNAINIILAVCCPINMIGIYACQMPIAACMRGLRLWLWRLAFSDDAKSASGSHRPTFKRYGRVPRGQAGERPFNAFIMFDRNNGLQIKHRLAQWRAASGRVSVSSKTMIMSRAKAPRFDAHRAFASFDSTSLFFHTFGLNPNPNKSSGGAV